MERMVWIAVGLMLISIAGTGLGQGEKVNVVVTINVLQDIVEHIGGDRVSVRSLVTGLENPHTYSTTPDDRKAVEDADLFVEIGIDLEPWAKDLTVDVLKEKILVASDNCTKLGDNPHVWMDPENGKIIATEIEHRLESIDPANAGYYRANLRSYLESLNSTEERIIELSRDVRGKGVITATPGYSYLLHYMGIDEVDTIVKGPGKEPSTQDIMRIEDEINSGKAGAIVAIAQIKMPVVDQISGDTGAPVIVGTVLLGALGVDSYEGLLLYDAGAISSGLEKADMQIRINSLESDIDAINGEIAILAIGLIVTLLLAVAEAYEIWKLRRGEW